MSASVISKLSRLAEESLQLAIITYSPNAIHFRKQPPTHTTHPFRAPRDREYRHFVKSSFNAIKQSFFFVLIAVVVAVAVQYML